MKWFRMVVWRLLAGVLLVLSGVVGCQQMRTVGRSGGGGLGVGLALEHAQRLWGMAPVGREAERSLVVGYNEAVRDVLTALSRQVADVKAWKGRLRVEGWEVEFPEGRSVEWVNPSWCDEVVVIERARSGRVVRPVRGEGWGVPVMMVQKFDPKRASDVKLFPLNGRWLPATLTAEFKGARRVELRFHHTCRVQKGRVRGGMRQLAYDVTTPLSRSMDKGFLSEFAIKGFLDADKELANAGVFVPGMYDPSKIPVVFVHGLGSDPHIWLNAMNEVLADPQLRQRYQPWYFLYPTGLPVHVSAAKLRLGLQRALGHYDPGGKAPALRQMVLVGHSMGGLLSRMQIVSSGEDFYAAYFRKPLSGLRVSASSRALMKTVLYFDKMPFVKRAVFVATPHQGSRVAELGPVRFILKFVRRVVRVDELIDDILTNAADAVRPNIAWQRRDGGRSSIDTLSPSHPVLKALAQRPLLVPFHSIIAVWGWRNKPLAESSDGAVPYRSAHVAGAQSELLVSSFHSCTGVPEVAAEICRILREHVGR